MNTKLLTHNGIVASPFSKPFIPLAGWLRRAWALMNLWNDRREQRLHLQSLSNEILKDIGLNRGDIYREATKWFWQS
ncbi:MAG: DUF1127 domain-containing protein [Deltaproteobacteria bacterium]|nr:DUF1127 domain-containing protein [Deltaproteobacteria bacterium]